ncbi:MAG TPA: hypothetical protein VG916_06275 [Gemmatimonadaceae bacterium]|nr:hypothetical protein [Gemmatimonadaceae bacterium]
MSDEHGGPRLVRDDALTAALRAIYRRPTSEAYWAALEGRIMARIDESEAWWSVSDRWVRIGLAAPAAKLLVAGGLFLRAQARINRTLAAEAVVEVEGLESALAQREPLSQEEATLRKLTGHQ